MQSQLYNINYSLANVAAIYPTEMKVYSYSKINRNASLSIPTFRLETTQVSTNRQTNEQSRTLPRLGILVDNYKELLVGALSSSVELCKLQEARLLRPHTLWLHLYNIPGKTKLGGQKDHWSLGGGNRVQISEGHEGTFTMMYMLCVLKVVVFPRLGVCQNARSCTKMNTFTMSISFHKPDFV